MADFEIERPSVELNQVNPTFNVNPPQFTIEINGSIQGQRGEKGDKGDAGEPGRDGIDGINGIDGVDGEDGVGVESIIQTSTSHESGGTNIITATLTDGTETTFEIMNGEAGSAAQIKKFEFNDILDITSTSDELYQELDECISNKEPFFVTDGDDTFQVIYSYKYNNFLKFYYLVNQTDVTTVTLNGSPTVTVSYDDIYYQTLINANNKIDFSLIDNAPISSTDAEDMLWWSSYNTVNDANFTNGYYTVVKEPYRLGDLSTESFINTEAIMHNVSANNWNRLDDVIDGKQEAVFIEMPTNSPPDEGDSANWTTRTSFVSSEKTKLNEIYSEISDGKITKDVYLISPSGTAQDYTIARLVNVSLNQYSDIDEDYLDAILYFKGVTEANYKITYKVVGYDVDIPADTIWKISQIEETSFTLDASDMLQEKLVSGTNIKTINNESLLGSGNIDIQSTETDVQINGSSIVSNDVANIQVEGTYNSSTNKIATMSEIPTKVSDLSNDSGFITSETDPIFSASAAAGISSSDISNWNGKSNFSGNYNDLSNKPTIPDELSDLTDDTTHRLVTDSEKTTWSGKQDALVSGTNIKTINSQSLLGSGNIDISGGGGSATDVQVNGTSITSGGVANLLTETAYNSSTNKIATMSDLPTKVSDLTNDSNFISGLVMLTYGTSTWQDFLDAHDSNKVVYCKVTSQYGDRMAFLAYKSSTSVEFQYYRSLSTPSISDQVDEVYVYTLKNNNKWTTTTRKASSTIAVGTGLSRSYTANTRTMSLSVDTSTMAQKSDLPTKTSDLTNDSGFITSSSLPTKVSDLTNDAGYITGYTETDPVFVASAAHGITSTDITNWNNKSTFSGSYNDLTDKPTIPTVNNATLTIQKNGTTVKTFTANASSNVTANITVPTKTSDLNNDSGFTTNTGTITSVKMNGSTISSSGEADLGTVLTSHQSIKTINNNSLVGSGNLTLPVITELTSPVLLNDLTDGYYHLPANCILQIKEGENDAPTTYKTIGTSALMQFKIKTDSGYPLFSYWIIEDSNDATYDSGEGDFTPTRNGTIIRCGMVSPYTSSSWNEREFRLDNTVTYADVIDNLTSNNTNRPLSAKQGKVLKDTIDAITIPTKTSDLINDEEYIAMSDLAFSSTTWIDALF